LAASAAADLFSGKNLEAFDSESEDIPHEPPGARSGPRLNVRAAAEDIQNQLAELDRSRGILEESSVSLFERVREALRRSFSSGRLGSNR
jgi:hypothetical protein